MIGCDNDLCPIEWFHLNCVQLSCKPPRGKWYCPKCRGNKQTVKKPKAQFLKELAIFNKEREAKKARSKKEVNNSKNTEEDNPNSEKQDEKNKDKPKKSKAKSKKEVNNSKNTEEDNPKSEKKDEKNKAKLKKSKDKSKIKDVDNSKNTEENNPKSEKKDEKNKTKPKKSKDKSKKEVNNLEIDPNEPTYCLCEQVRLHLSTYIKIVTPYLK